MAGEKKYEPTRRKLEKARRDGDFAKSQVFGNALRVCCGLLVLRWIQSDFAQLARLSEGLWGVGADFSSRNVLRLAACAIANCSLILGKFLLVVFLVAVFVEVLQVGCSVSFRGLSFRGSRLNLTAGLKRVLHFGGPEGSAGFPAGLLFEVCKHWVGIVSGLAFLTLVVGLLCREFVIAGELSSEVIRLLAERWVCWTTFGLAGALLGFGLFDRSRARRRRLLRLRMDANEIRQEFREQEGSPEQHALRKQLHREVITRSIEDSIRRARVLVVSKTKR
ncbi:MAG: EscU/YscU/HrcU family type III secretion system export apparatus switch protein [Bdellovibrionales bacterium]|nr:EscU/YscU/HrcU family type III secretion system export apparatus switch protein [Bdellovibrionales bacterium]